jgi:hypothetical protein
VATSSTPSRQQVAFQMVGMLAGVSAAVVTSLVDSFWGMLLAVVLGVVGFLAVMAATGGVSKVEATSAPPTAPPGLYGLIACSLAATGVAVLVHVFLWRSDQFFLVLVFALHAPVCWYFRAIVDSPISSRTPQFFVGLAYLVALLTMTTYVLARP